MTSTTVCVASAALLFAATAFTCRLPWPQTAAISVPVLGGYVAILVFRPDIALVANVSILVVAAAVGSLLGTLVGNLPGLVSFSVAASIVDIVSTQVGTTAKLTHAFHAGTSDLLQYLSVSFILGGQLRPIVGIGDLIILTAIYFSLRRNGHDDLLAFAAPAAGLLLALATGLLVGGVFAIPFISATTIAYVVFRRRNQDA